MLVCGADVGRQVLPFLILVCTVPYRTVVNLMFCATDLEYRVKQINSFSAPEAVAEEVIQEPVPEVVHANPPSKLNGCSLSGSSVNFSSY